MSNDYHPSNRLYSGELNDNPLDALWAVVKELEMEAAFAERPYMGVQPDEISLKYASDFRKDAEYVEKTRKFVVSKLEEFYKSLALEVREKQMAGDWSDGIADSLEDGDWSRLAI